MGHRGRGKNMENTKAAEFRAKFSEKVKKLINEIKGRI